MNAFVSTCFDYLDAAWPWLLGASIKTAAWLALAAVVLRLSRRASASTRHALAVIAAIGLPVIFLLNLSWMPDEYGWRPFERDLRAVTRTSLLSPGGTLTQEVNFTTTSPKGPASQDPRDSASLSFWDSISRGLTAMWCLGLATGILLLFRRCLKCPTKALPQARLAGPEDPLSKLVTAESRRQHLKRAPLLWLTPDAMPMTFGLFRPALVLPREARAWPRQKTWAIVRHELAHIRRRDLWSTLLSSLCFLLTWWNPLSWVLRRRIAEWREQACDDAVLTSGLAAVPYADHLLSLLPRKPTTTPAHACGWALPAASHTGRVKRFRRLLDIGAARKPAGTIRVILFSVFAFALILPGTLLVSCRTLPTGGDATPAPALAPAGPAPKIPSVPRNAKELHVRLNILEFPLPDLLDDPVLTGFVAGDPKVLPPEEGWRLFHTNQSGLDLMSAPTVVLPQGEKARVAVTREFIYPVSMTQDLETGEAIPGEFTTTDVGVIIELAVKPTGDPSVLNANLKPLIREFLNFRKSENHPGLDEPVFRETSQTFSGKFPNGGYLFIGIREDKQDVEEKVPLLGDLPAIGELFTHRTQLVQRFLTAVQMIVSEETTE